MLNALPTFWMNTILKLLLFSGVITLGCKTDDLPNDLPDCVRKEIKQIEKQGVWNPPARVFSYTYKGKTVYYIPPRCCDIPSTLLDENCQPLCFPSGGFTGAGDGKCLDFFTSRSAEKLIWQDSRK